MDKTLAGDTQRFSPARVSSYIMVSIVFTKYLSLLVCLCLRRDPKEKHTLITKTEAKQVTELILESVELVF